MAASALSGKISGPGWHKRPEEPNKLHISMGEGDGIKEEDRMITTEEALEKVIGQLDGIIEAADRDISLDDKTSPKEDTQLTEVLPGFPEKVEGEIVFCDADNMK